MASKYNSKNYQKVSVFEDHHVYKAIWKTPMIGIELSVKSKDSNEHEYTIVMIKDDQFGSQICFVAIISSLRLRQWTSCLTPNSVLTPDIY